MSVWYLFSLLLAITCVNGDSLVISPEKVVIAEGTSTVLDFRFTDCEENTTNFNRDVSLKLLAGLETNIGFPRKVSNVPCLANETHGSGANATIQALLIGFVTIELFNEKTGERYLDYPVGITRPPPQIQDQIYIYGLMVLVACTTFTFGISLDLKKVKKYAKKPVAPAIGMVCQFILMPLVGFAIASAMPTHKAIKLGIFASAVAPGGGLSNIWCFVLNADLDLSITMTFLSTIASIGFVPLWMYTLGQYIIGDEEIQLPFTNILSTLALLVVPLTLGLLINKFLPKVAKKLLIIQKPVILTIILFAGSMSIWTNLYAFKMVMTSYQLALSTFLLPYAGGLFGFLLALVFKQGRRLSTTIGIETAIQNINIATILLKTSLPQPWADISSVIPITMIVFTFTPFPFMLAGQQIYLRWRKQKEDQVEKEEPESRSNSSVKLSEKEGVDNPAVINDEEV